MVNATDEDFCPVTSLPCSPGLASGVHSGWPALLPICGSPTSASERAGSGCGGRTVARILCDQTGGPGWSRCHTYCVFSGTFMDTGVERLLHSRVRDTCLKAWEVWLGHWQLQWDTCQRDTSPVFSLNQSSILSPVFLSARLAWWLRSVRGGALLSSVVMWSIFRL